jgi:hypothetical protein
MFMFELFFGLSFYSIMEHNDTRPLSPMPPDSEIRLGLAVCRLSLLSLVAILHECRGHEIMTKMLQSFCMGLLSMAMGMSVSMLVKSTAHQHHVL